MKTLGITPRRVLLSEFVEVRRQINESAVLEVYETYQERFEIASSLDEPLLLRSAKNELVLRHLLEKYQSRALAVNFLDVCGEPEIADALHLPVSNLMAEGIGYGAEADWETASLISAMQTVLGNAHVGFTEVFSVDYGENRVLLRHWGEGNPAQAAGKPRVIKSALNLISTHTAFPICDFQFCPGKYSLLNLSVTSEGQGQIITLSGKIEEARLPYCDGVKSLFKADCTDVRELLNQYAMLGGSHHLVLKRLCSVVHGHWKEPAFQRNLLEWFQVNAMLQAIRSVNPLVLGERFPDMLDLRLENEPFMKTLGITPRRVLLSEFVEVRRQINESAVLEVYETYQERFEIASSLDEPLLLRSAKNELVLRHLLEKYQSRALAVNFLDVCGEPEIADALHLPVSNLMAEGIGYGAEADWETASLISAMQTVLGNAHVGFTEVFSVDYGENRVLLRHWGEGNPAQAAGKPRVIKSALNLISTHTAFPICDFQFCPGKYSLLNLSVTSEGQGQIITLSGKIEEARLPYCDGVKSLFKADCTDVRELLNQYAMLGGSHHLVLLDGDVTQFAEKLAQQAGWVQYTIK